MAVSHKEKTLKKVSNPDYVEVNLPEKCKCCGRSFTEKDKHQTVKSRRVFDISELKLEITEH
ncbi:MAG: hypothetical protein QM487_11940 [Candidatus Marithrix sp.]